VLKKDLAAKLEITKAALLAAIKSGTDMLVQTEQDMLVDPTVATQDWKDMKKEEALLELASHTTTDKVHLSHKNPWEWWPNAMALCALEGVVCSRDNTFARISNESNSSLEDEVDNVRKCWAFLPACMVNLEQATAQKRDVGDYQAYNDTRDYAAKVVAPVATAESREDCGRMPTWIPPSQEPSPEPSVVVVEDPRLGVARMPAAPSQEGIDDDDTPPHK